MAKTASTRTPKYRRQKSKPHDRAFVCLDSEHRTYLGRHGSRESKEAYHRLLAEWTAAGGQPPIKANELTIVELTARFWLHVESYYWFIP